MMRVWTASNAKRQDRERFIATQRAGWQAVIGGSFTSRDGNGPPPGAPRNSQPSPVAAGKQPSAIFVHGFGTSESDLAPLAAAFRERGIECTLVTLAGHRNPAEDATGIEAQLSEADAETWVDQVRQAVDVASGGGRDVYLVGFSLGAAISLAVAAERDVAGVLGLSTFVRPTKRRLARLALRFRRFPPVGSRKPRVTKRSTRRELIWERTLPTRALREVIQAGPRLSVVPKNRRVLLVHSVDDPVASYEAVVEQVQRAASDDARLVTLSGLGHFVQFDVPSHALCNLALAHFDRRLPGPDLAHPAWIENVKQREEEVRHWANVLSVLFGGFFTLFGTLLKATLSEVIENRPTAPYLLFAYALLVAGYLEFVFLYFFYMNRTQAYLRTYLDPFQTVGVGWTFYRTTAWASGRASRQMTGFVSASAIALPFAFALFCVAYAVLRYDGRLFDRESLELQLLAVASLCWLVHAVYTGSKLVRYTRVHLYLVPPVVPASAEFLRALQQLYASVSPGVVRQAAQSAPARSPGTLDPVSVGAEGAA